MRPGRVGGVGWRRRRWCHHLKARRPLRSTGFFPFASCHLRLLPERLTCHESNRPGAHHPLLFPLSSSLYPPPPLFLPRLPPLCRNRSREWNLMDPVVLVLCHAGFSRARTRTKLNWECLKEYLLSSTCHASRHCFFLSSRESLLALQAKSWQLNPFIYI